MKSPIYVYGAIVVNLWILIAVLIEFVRVSYRTHLINPSVIVRIWIDCDPSFEDLRLWTCLSLVLDINKDKREKGFLVH